MAEGMTTSILALTLFIFGNKGDDDIDLTALQTPFLGAWGMTQ